MCVFKCTIYTFNLENIFFRDIYLYLVYISILFEKNKRFLYYYCSNMYSFEGKRNKIRKKNGIKEIKKSVNIILYKMN